MRNAALKTREIEPDVYLPFGRHVTDTVIGLTTRVLLTVIRIDGTSFETAETSDLNDLHGKLNLTLRNIADPRLALWTHLVRRRTSVYPDGTFRSTFAAELDAQYREQLRKEALFRNDLYLTLVCHPGARGDGYGGRILQATWRKRRALRRGRQRGPQAAWRCNARYRRSTRPLRRPRGRIG